MNSLLNMELYRVCSNGELGFVTFLGHASSNSELNGVISCSFALVFPLLLLVLEDLHPLCQRHFGPHINVAFLSGKSRTTVSDEAD